MSGTDGRLNKLYPALSAKERAVLILRALKQGGEEDPLVRRTMPYDQGWEFNLYVELMNSVNGHLATCIQLLRSDVSRLGAALGWLASLYLCAVHCDRKALPARRSETDGDRVQEHDALRDKLISSLKAVLHDGAGRAWGTMRAIEAALAEVTEDLDGEDPLLPPLRALLDDVRRKLEEMAEQVAPFGVAIDLPDGPDGETLKMVRKFLGTASQGDRH